MDTKANQVNVSAITAKTSDSASSANSSPVTFPTKISVEVPSGSAGSWNILDPSWLQLWEQAGSIGFLILLCLLVWLLTRFVEAVKKE